MKAIYSLTLLVIIYSIAISCQPGTHSYELDGGYVYDSMGSNFNHVAKSKRDLANYTGKRNIRHIKANLYSWITALGSDDNFIIVVQKPLKKYHILDIAYELRFSFPEEICEKMADSLITYDPFFQEVFDSDENYWIISHANDSLYGPFNEKEFLNQKKRLGVPKELELKSTTAKPLWEAIKSVFAG